MELTISQRKHIFGWLFVLPVILGTLIFNILPVVPTLLFSLTAWKGFTSFIWVGLRNYTDLLFHDRYFWISVRVTFFYMCGTVAFGMIASLTLAVLVNRPWKGIKIFRTLYFIPVVTSMVAIGIVFKVILDYDYGVVNQIIKFLGGRRLRWLGDPWLVIPSVIVVTVWQGMGYYMIIFLAGLQGIPQILYEAAEIDGATSCRKFFSITLPLLSPIIFFVLILSIINAFTSFQIIYAMTRGGPGYSTAVYTYRLWEQGFVYFKMGYASAMAWIMFVVIGLITIFQWKISKYWVYYR